ncbi:unnamed protein product [Strongylus vulgaris]|uniref:Peptidase M12A domain-containing protein n=1 Tax=Strongylus vulgaris TaxID=40348 RepID=A0A3P7JTJ1_STRVU|nr:unnamed protein product [Strongylus vulgaris]
MSSVLRFYSTSQRFDNQQFQIGPRELNTYRLPYDVGSVMHYTPTEFSSYKSVPALTTVDPNLQQTMGQMEGPSFLDVMALNLHYNCQGQLHILLDANARYDYEEVTPPTMSLPAEIVENTEEQSDGVNTTVARM